MGDESDESTEEAEEDVSEAPPAPPGLDLLAPPAPAEDEEGDAEAPPAPPADLLAPVEDADDDADDADDDAVEQDAGDDAEPALAGGKIRSASDVDAIPGHKLVGTLEESEDVTLSPDGEMVKQSVKGVLTLSNPSDKDRLWDIDVILNDATHSDIESDLPFSELEAGADQSVDYSCLLYTSDAADE